MMAPLPHPDATPVSARVTVLTTTDQRTASTDETGRSAMELFRAAGHRPEGPVLTPNEPAAVRAAIEHALAGGADLVLVTGGTGISRRDLSADVVEEMIGKRLEGFGELFRFLGYSEIGSAAMLSRAVLGVTGEGKLLACVPGSPNGMRLALEKLLLPELPHLLHELRK